MDAWAPLFRDSDSFGLLGILSFNLSSKPSPLPLPSHQVIWLCSQVWEWCLWTKDLRYSGHLLWLPSSIWSRALCSGDSPPHELWWWQHLFPGPQPPLQLEGLEGLRVKPFQSDTPALDLGNWNGNWRSQDAKVTAGLSAGSGCDTKNEFLGPQWKQVRPSISCCSSSILIASFWLVSGKQPSDPLL